MPTRLDLVESHEDDERSTSLNVLRAISYYHERNYETNVCTYLKMNESKNRSETVISAQYI